MFISIRMARLFAAFAIVWLIASEVTESRVGAESFVLRSQRRQARVHDRVQVRDSNHAAAPEVHLSVELVPNSVLPGEPVAVYTTLSNRGRTAVSTYLKRDNPALYYRDGAGKEIRLPPYEGIDATMPMELKPGDSVRRKTWVLWCRLETVLPKSPFGSRKNVDPGEGGREERAVARERRYAFPAVGEYRIYARSGYVAEGRPVALVSEPVVLRIREPRGREARAKALLADPLPPFVQMGGQRMQPYPGLDAVHLFLTQVGPPILPAKPILEEKGASRVAASLVYLQGIYPNLADTAYGWYAALVLARWESHALVVGDSYQKPARFELAAEILKSIEGGAMPSALREEVLALQAEAHYAMGKREAADAYLKRLEAMDPAEPVASEVERIRRTWRTMAEMVTALEQGDWQARGLDASWIRERRPDVAEEVFRRAFGSDDDLARLLGACELNPYYADAEANAYLWERFEDPPAEPYAFGWLLSALAREKRPEFQSRLKEQLEHADPVVRIWTAETLWLYYRDRSGVPVLIDILEKGREPDDYPNGGVVGGLRRTTGQNLGRDAAAWRGWWREHQPREHR